MPETGIDPVAKLTKRPPEHRGKRQLQEGAYRVYPVWTQWVLVAVRLASVAVVEAGPDRGVDRNIVSRRCRDLRHSDRRGRSGGGAEICRNCIAQLP
jgi:hypothetical protein